ncbi:MULTISPECIES: hypothetical protein [Pasteurellaceae]|uniref:hypothetical protein n=2 Tax=Pasteurellales TaxID=135625 RepID=UPI0005096B0F|nr:hypothetical protein AUSP0078_00009 [uncultured phage]
MKISLPKKKSYSLDELPEYLAKTYQLDLSHDDLIVYARENKLKTCIRLEGNAKGLYSVGRIKLDEQNLIPVCYPPTAVFFNSTIKKSFLPHDLHLEDEYACFGARVPLINAIYKEIQDDNLDFYSATRKAKTNINEFIEKSDYAPEYEYQLSLIPQKFSFSFSADFYLPRDIYNTSTRLLDSHIISIDFTDDYLYLLGNTNKENIFINLAINTRIAQPIGVHFKDIEILHRDLMEFLGISEDPENNIDELHKEIDNLKVELAEKNNQITELQAALNDKNIPILLGECRKDDPLKIAIEVRNKYWADYPENVKSNKQIQSYIMRDYDVTKTTAAEIEKIACPIDRKKN